MRGYRMGQVVLVTGVSRHLGGALARDLTAHPSVDRVIGVDVVPPPHSLGAAEFVRADIQTTRVAAVIEEFAVDTVAHLNVIATPVSAGGRVAMKDINIIGTMKLLAACQKAPSIRRLVVKSSAAVYGSSPQDPALFTEDMTAETLPRSGFGKDSVEVESYVRGFSRRRSGVEVTVLRLANVIGPHIATPMTDYFTLPVIPTAWGFDARLQFLHEQDAVDVLAAAVTHERGLGVVNVAGDGALTVTQAARLAGRVTVPVPLPSGDWLGQVVRRAGLVDFSPDQLRHLVYGRGLDTTRMRTMLGFAPRWTTREAFADFAAAQRGPVPLLVPQLLQAVTSARAWALERAEVRAASAEVNDD
ncbi:MAG: NAD-dependent epimerase/dehydratase family protein [Actinomycetota bacterium]